MRRNGQVLLRAPTGQRVSTTHGERQPTIQRISTLVFLRNLGGGKSRKLPCVLPVPYPFLTFGEYHSTTIESSRQSPRLREGTFIVFCWHHRAADGLMVTFRRVIESCHSMGHTRTLNLASATGLRYVGS